MGVTRRPGKETMHVQLKSKSFGGNVMIRSRAYIEIKERFYWFAAAPSLPSDKAFLPICKHKTLQELN